MPSLPQDVLLLVISRLDIDSFLNARLLDRATHDLIIRHIRGLVASVAQATFANELGFLAKRSLPADSGASAYLTWLRALRYQYLAAVMLECRGVNAKRDSDLAVVSAEDPVGDDARFHFVAGLRVLNEFAVIARAVEVLPQEQLRGDAGSLARTSGSAQDDWIMCERLTWNHYTPIVIFGTKKCVTNQALARKYFPNHAAAYTATSIVDPSHEFFMSARFDYDSIMIYSFQMCSSRSLSPPPNAGRHNIGDKPVMSDIRIAQLYPKGTKDGDDAKELANWGPKDLSKDMIIDTGLPDWAGGRTKKRREHLWG
ncbi:hypothetical protein B0A48_11975 [Cryoendolithus antarcticus]|uniref:F-box domain-containing protein n=1 Tax=Cryoendolithus antarcticus TaxID=1507870 RepID=A0A1V8STX7_9PEZI|nr:hypothetical protein B0A48_11975 [Cryoendolithus antarcticus]